jgi:hypothetical protein
MPLTALSQEKFTLAGQVDTTNFPQGNWDGKASFPNVYCLSFPQPEKVKSFRKAYFNNRAVYLIDAFYSDELTATLAVSTIPNAQSPTDAIAKVRQNEQANATRVQAAGIRYTVTESATDFGPSVSVVIRNAAPGNSVGPFPLVRAFISNPQRPITTLSVHRLFVRGHDRFEIALFQPAPQPPTESTEEEMVARLSGIADRMVESLQKCTASIPVRQPSSSSTQPEKTAVFDQLDVAAGWIHGRDYIIGNIGAECLTMLGRKESVQEFLGKWEERNAAYLEASVKHFQSRRKEAATRGDLEQREKMEREINEQAIQSANVGLDAMFARGDKVGVCKKVVPLVESKGMDVSDKDPFFVQLESLRKWAEQAH